METWGLRCQICKHSAIFFYNSKEKNMDKASKALRRSGVRIRSIGSGHGDLQMVIAQLKDVRTTGKVGKLSLFTWDLQSIIQFKAFSIAQSSAMQDLVKWSLKDENRAIQDALTQVGELFSVWTEVQRELNDHIKEFKHQVVIFRCCCTFQFLY